MSNRIEGIILAAGLSRRMGYPKLLARIGERSVIGLTADAVFTSALDHVTFVTGPDAGDLVAELDIAGMGKAYGHAVNLHPERGMSSSLRAGILSLDDRIDAVMIILADQPGLTAEVIDRLIGSWRKRPAGIIAPTVNGRRTTPVIFPKALFLDLSAVVGDKGGREVLRAHPEMIVDVEASSMYNDSDVDTPEELEAFKRLIKPDKNPKL